MSDGSEKMQVDVTYVFDEILARHMERLLGSRFGIGGLQLQIGTIACLTLIAEQLDEKQEDQPSEEENTTEVLESRLAELGLRDKDKVQSVIREMVEKGYLLADEQGKLSGGKPAISMARLMGRIFPKLPGKTLVAYFIQTIDEVLTGRKTTEVAVAHFDQTLKIQGLPLKNLKAEKTSRVQSAVKKESENLEDINKDKQRVLKRTLKPLTSKEEERAGFRIIGSADDGFLYKVREIQTISPEPSSTTAVCSEQIQENQPVSVKPPSLMDLENQPLSSDIPAAQVPESLDVPFETPLEQAPEVPPVPEEAPEETSGEISARTRSEGQGESQAVPELSFSSGMEVPKDVPPEAGKEETPAEEKDGPEEVEERPPDAEEPSSPLGSESAAAEQDPEHPEETGDDLIEKQVSGFQNELASLCPLCKEGKVREEKTGTGRVYFKCTNKSCNLVSWGRPHHISCPICNNPFLIEMSAGQEKANLQCPRATCKYQCTISQAEPLPGPSAGKNGAGATMPRRRVVRRRVVKKRK